MSKIKTWRERCRDFPNGHLTTSLDIERAMQAEIDELRMQLADYESAYGGVAVTKSAKTE